MDVASAAPEAARGLLAVGSHMAELVAVVALREICLNSVCISLDVNMA
jgi:hypothetical protein